ncbi:MAG: CARDB domain-containing protein, partial [Thermoplasmatota archaeon]
MKLSSYASHPVILAAGAVLLFVSSSIFGAFLVRTVFDEDVDGIEFTTWINEKRSIYLGMGKDGVSFDPDGNPRQAGGSREFYFMGGSLNWKVDLHDEDNEHLSTPLLVDLDGDGKLEVVATSTADVVMAYDSSGDPFWNRPCTDIVIDYLGQTAATSGLDFDPPHFFSSPKAYDPMDGQGPRILIGGKDGLHCLDSEGGLEWVGGSTIGNYFSSPAVIDIEGDFPSDRDQWEIAVTSDDEGRRGWIEILDMDGSTLMRTEAPTGGEGGLIGSAMVAEDLDGSFMDGAWKDEPDPGDERKLELLSGNHDRGLRIWSYTSPEEGGPSLKEDTTGWLAGHQTYATHAVANVSGGPEMEIFTGSSEGYPRSWTGWGGKIYVYSHDLKKLWDYSTGSSGASVFSSPAIADIQQAKFDPDEKELDYELIFGADTGYLYVMNTMWHSLLWRFDTGRSIRSSPAVCDINSDRELEIIIGSDSGVVYCFDGDPTDDVDEGINYPGDGAHQDVLWTYDAGAPVASSSPVVADIDNDGVQEVLIGDDSGTLHCISAGGGCRVGQRDWTSFHMDCNNTGFYNPDIRYFIDIHPRVLPDEEKVPTSVILKPGGFHTFNLTLSNRGTLVSPKKDEIHVSVLENSVPAGWKAYLDTPPMEGDDNPGRMKLYPGDSCDLSLTVWAPMDAADADIARIIVRANHTKDEWAKDEILLQVKLDIRPELEVDFDHPVDEDPLSPRIGMKWESIGQGAYIDLGLNIRNLGTLNDTVSLALSEPPQEAGWNWYVLGTGERSIVAELSAPHLARIFGGPSSLNLTIRVHAPPDAIADQDIPIVAQVSSWASIEVLDVPMRWSDVIYLIVSEVNDLWLDIVGSGTFSTPGTTDYIDLRISNLGNRDAIHVSLENSDLPGRWEIVLPEEPVLIFRGQTRTIPIELRYPLRAEAGTEFVLTLRGWIVDETHVSSKVSTVVGVTQVHDHELISYGDVLKDADPGTDVNFTVHVINNGNGDERFSFSFDGGGGWSCAVFDENGRRTEHLILGSFSQARLLVRYSIPYEALAGLWKMVLAVGTSTGTEYLRSDIWVAQVRGLSITGTAREPEIGMETQMDAVERFRFAIRNTGNGPERASLILGGRGQGGALIDLPDGMIAGLMSVSLSDAPGGIPSYWEPPEPLDLREGARGRLFIPYDRVQTGPVSGFRKSGTTSFSVELSPGMTAFVEYWVRRIPGADRTMIRASSLMVAAMCEGVRETLPVRVDFLYPELYFSDGIEIAGSSIEGYGDAYKGDRLTFLVKVGNRGETAARNVVVQLLIDDRQISNVTLPHVPCFPGESKLVMLSWEAEPGKHRVSMVIDPGDMIVELNEVEAAGSMEENRRSMELTVGGGEGGWSEWTVPIILLVLMAA